MPTNEDLQAQIAELKQQIKDSNARTAINAAMAAQCPTAPSAIKELAAIRLTAQLSDRGGDAGKAVGVFLQGSDVQNLMANAQPKEQPKPTTKVKVSLADALKDIASGGGQIKIG